MHSNKKYNVGIGLSSLFLLIPSPTLIHEYFNSLIADGNIEFLYTQFQGFEAQMLLILMSASCIGLFIVAIYSLGGYMTTLGDHKKLIDD